MKRNRKNRDYRIILLEKQGEKTFFWRPGEVRGGKGCFKSCKLYLGERNILASSNFDYIRYCKYFKKC